MPVARPPSAPGRFLPVTKGYNRQIEGRFRTNECLQRFFISPVALMEINGTSGVVFEAGVEET